MSIPRNKGFLNRVWEEPFIYEIVIATAAAFVAIYEGFFSKMDKTEAKVICICALIVFLFTVLKHFAAWKKTSKKESIHELEGCLHTLHAALSPSGDDTLRITIHVPVGGDRELQQVINYVVDTEDRKTVGRKFAIQSGVAGAAFRRNEVLWGERVEDDLEKYFQELVKTWGYVLADAKKCNPGTRSWFAIPLTETGNNKKVEGVIYFDSNKRDFFTSERQELAMKAATGIARFIGIRYSS